MKQNKDTVDDNIRKSIYEYLEVLKLEQGSETFNSDMNSCLDEIETQLISLPEFENEYHYEKQKVEIELSNDRERAKQHASQTDEDIAYDMVYGKEMGKAAYKFYLGIGRILVRLGTKHGIFKRMNPEQK